MAGPIRISILANASGAKRAFKETGTDAEKTGKKVSRVGSVMKGALAAAGIFEGLELLKEGLKGVFEKAEQVEKVGRQTEAVLKSQGLEARLSAKGVEALTKSLSTKNAVDRLQVQNNANLLLRYQGIAQAVGKNKGLLKDYTQATLDYSAATGKPATMATKLLGKSMNDPLKGLTLLQGAGVKFTAQQQAQIKADVAAGKVSKARAIEMQAFNKSFGGSARAAATPTAKLHTLFSNLLTDIAEKLVPVIAKVAEVAADKLPKAFAAAKPYIADVAGVIGGFRAKLEPVIGFLKKNPATVKAFAITFGVLAGAVGVVSLAMGILDAVLAINPFVLLAVAIAAVVAGLVYAYQHSEKFRTVVQAAFSAVQKVVSAVLPVVVTIVKVYFKLVALYVRTYVKVVTAVVRAAWAVVKAVTRVAWAIFKTFVLTPVKAVVSGVRALVGRIVAAVRSVGSAIGKVKSKITGAFGNAKTLLSKIGGQIVSGLAAGIRGSVQKVLSAVHDLLMKIPKKVRDLLGIHSPSRVMKAFGVNIGEGLALGIRQSRASVSRAMDSLTSTVTGGQFTVDATTGTGGRGQTVVYATINVSGALPGTEAQIGKGIASFLDSYYAVGG